MRFICLLVATFILSGCVTTKTTGYVDPKYRDSGYTVSKVVVRIGNATMEETQIAEQTLVEKFNDYGVDAIKYTDIVPLTRSYSDKKKRRLIKNTGADVVFIMTLSKSKVDDYVPQTYHPGTTASRVNYGYVTTHTTPGYTTGGYSTSSPTMFTVATLSSIRNGEQIWKAEGQSSGIEISSYADLLVNAGVDAIDDMKEKGLLPEIKSEKITKPEKEK